MNILVCVGASEPSYTSSKSFIRALKRAGYDVRTCGAYYKYDRERTEQVDFELEDKCFPELYTYEEVLKSTKDFKADIILQIEPHFYLCGEKPKDIKSYYWILDPHRGGYAYRNLAKQGDFNALFMSQTYFSDSYLEFAKKIYFFPQAVDIDRIKYDENIKAECDIAFIGETGIADRCMRYDKRDADNYEYTNLINDNYILDSEIYKDYAERAKLLMLLSRGFDVRIYKKNFNTDYSKIIQKGKIAFHRSLFKDITLRNFESLALKRALVCDYVPNLEKLMINYKHCLMYKAFGFNTELENFKLDYEQAKEAVDILLKDDKMRNDIAENAYQHVMKYHTFDNRVKEMMSVITG
jgi:glycosyltransferase involved in cell wall biosynthesis